MDINITLSVNGKPVSATKAIADAIVTQPEELRFFINDERLETPLNGLEAKMLKQIINGEANRRAMYLLMRTNIFTAAILVFAVLFVITQH